MTPKPPPLPAPAPPPPPPPPPLPMPPSGLLAKSMPAGLTLVLVAPKPLRGVTLRPLGDPTLPLGELSSAPNPRTDTQPGGVLVGVLGVLPDPPLPVPPLPGPGRGLVLLLAMDREFRWCPARTWARTGPLPSTSPGLLRLVEEAAAAGLPATASPWWGRAGRGGSRSSPGVPIPTDPDPPPSPAEVRCVRATGRCGDDAVPLCLGDRTRVGAGWVGCAATLRTALLDTEVRLTRLGSGEGW